MEERKEEMREVAKPKRSAGSKPVTEKPGTRLAAKRIMKVLMTKVKRPRVRMFMGRVRRSKRGRKNWFNTPRTMATMAAVIRPPESVPTSTPEIR